MKHKQSQLLDFEILLVEPQPCEQASKTAKPIVEAFAVVHSLNDKAKMPPTLTDATKVNQIPVNEMKTTTPKTDAPALQNSLLNDYAEVFQKTIQTKNFKHNINHHIITSGPPVKSNLQQLSPEKLTFVKEEIAQLLKDGIITPSSSLYASPIHIVPKSQPRKFRMVGDYRALNTTTQPDRYPLPFFNDFADMLHGCSVFSKLVCYKGYHQIPMAAEDAYKTAIITPVGLYEYKMMPFGLRNSRNTYQRYIDQVTCGLPFCFAFVDDVLVASHSLEEHEQHL